MAAAPAKVFVDHRFHYSCDVDLEVKVFVTCALLKCVNAGGDEALQHASNVSVTAQLVSGGLAMHPTPRRTQLPDKVTHAVFWNEWLSLPVKYNQLPVTAQLVLRLWDPAQNCIGGATLRLFDERRRLKRGMQRVALWPSKRSTAAADAGDTASPVRIQTPDVAAFYLRDERLRLTRLQQQRLRRLAEEAPWLLPLTRRQLQKVLATSGGTACICEADPALAPDKDEPGSTAAVHAPAPPDFDALLIEFPRFPHPVVFEEKPYDSSPFAASLSAATFGSTAQHAGVGGVGAGRSPVVGAHVAAHVSAVDTNVVHDPEAGVENPVSAKYHRLARGLTRGDGRGAHARLIDLELRPNREEKARIEDMLHDPSSHLAPQDAALLWKFRFYLRTNKKALTKFLLCVAWDVAEEVRQALELLREWAPIDTEDALRMLCPEYIHPEVRKHAVDTLDRASDEELLCYLLQLVQALRFERWDSGSGPGAGGGEAAGAGAGAGAGARTSGRGMDGGGPGHGLEGLPPLARLLVRRSCRSVEMATNFYWFLYVETQDSATHGQMYSSVLAHFQDAMALTPESRKLYGMIELQCDLVAKLQAAAGEATKNRRANINTKIANLNSLLSKNGAYSALVDLRPPVVLPLNPSIQVTGVVPGAGQVFRSAMYPVMVSFYVKDDEGDAESSEAKGASSDPPPAAGTSDEDTRSTYKVMIKLGDDIRQDQLVLQLIRLIDFQLKRLNIDLKLTPYRVLATSPKTGMLEIVPNSRDVSKVIQRGGVQEFFREHHPDPSAEFGIKKEVMDTYVKSCAGYCVITYLLGIGDRHLDNLMLQTDGHLFHIDFGFIFGRDPKPYPPPMKLTKEMVEGMGGSKNPQQSKNYQEFKKFACEAYNELRKSAQLVLNLLRLMHGCAIRDLQTDAETTIMKVQEKFRLDISREDAERTFLALIDSSVSALFPVLVENLHRVAAMMR